MNEKKIAGSWHSDKGHKTWPFDMIFVCIRHFLETLGTTPRPGWPIPDTCICLRCSRRHAPGFRLIWNTSIEEFRSGNYLPALYYKLHITHEARYFLDSIAAASAAEASDPLQQTVPSTTDSPTRPHSAHSQPSDHTALIAGDDEEAPSQRRSLKNPRVASTSQHHYSHDASPRITVSSGSTLSGQ